MCSFSLLGVTYHQFSDGIHFVITVHFEYLSLLHVWVTPSGTFDSKIALHIAPVRVKLKTNRFLVHEQRCENLPLELYLPELETALVVP